MRSCAWAVVALSCLGLPVSAARSAVEVLEPTSKWQVDYGDNRCLAGRVFGAGDDAVTLLMDQSAPGDSFQFRLVGPRFRSWSEDSGGFIQFGPTLPKQKLEFFLGSYGKDKPALFARTSLRISPLTDDERKAWQEGKLLDLPEITRSQKASVKTIEVRRGARAFQLATGPLDRLFAEMDKCLGAVVKIWGYDPAVMAQLKSPPRAKPSARPWLTDDDYPAAASARGQRAMISVRLDIDALGAVTGCNVVRTTKGIEFEKVVCAALMKRAKFEPAIGPDGKPVAAYKLQNVTFVM